LSYRFNLYTRDAGSTEIIGGADGPTAVFVSGYPYYHLFTIIFSLLTILGSIYLVVTKYKNKHN
jgi:Na+-transporting methylmalonyl-CoA/oxaloacetate decarboxylase beta subunit